MTNLGKYRGFFFSYDTTSLHGNINSAITQIRKLDEDIRGTGMVDGGLFARALF